MSPLYILEKIEGELTDCGRLARFAPDRAFVLRTEPFRLGPVGLQSHDAKSPCANTERGDDAVGCTGAWVLNHSGTPAKHPHLRPV